QVITGPLLPVPDPRRIEEHEVGGPPLGDAAAVAQAVGAGGDVAQLGDRILEGDHLVRADAVGQEGGGVDGATHHVDVGAGVGAADHRARVPPDLGPQLPVLGRGLHTAG